MKRLLLLLICLTAAAAHGQTLREQAEQLKWSGKPAQAIVIFDQILQAEPNNVDVLNSKAEALSWLDKLETALALYQKVLTIEPENLTAQNGAARMLVWQGNNRRGVAAYQKIVQAHPDNLDAWHGLSQAENWNNRDDRAVAAIQKALALKPDDQEAIKLKKQIANAQTIFVNQFNYHSYDKNNLDVTYNGLRIGRHFDLLTAGELVYQRQRSANAGEVIGQRVGLVLNRRFSDLVEFNTYLYANEYDALGFRPFTSDTWLTLRPSDAWRLDLSLNRGLFEDVGSLTNKIIVDSAGLSADFKPDRFWLVSASFKKGSYSDGNSQNTFFGRIEYRLLNNPYLKLYYNCYYSDWARQLNAGYFNPASILSQSLGFFTSINASEQLSAELKLSAGYENQKPTADHPTYFFGAGLNYRFSPGWLANLRGEAFEATPDPNSNGYSKKSITFGLTYNFAVNPPGLVNAQSPSRVIN